MVLLCHDLIPLLGPQFYRKRDVDLFRSYMHRALATADRIIVTSRRTHDDCRTYCAQHQIPVADIVVAPLGFDVRIESPPAAALPGDLKSGQFVLMVSAPLSRARAIACSTAYGSASLQMAPFRRTASNLSSPVASDGWSMTCCRKYAALRESPTACG
jgi:hypothetical protein